MCFCEKAQARFWFSLKKMLEKLKHQEASAV